MDDLTKIYAGFTFKTSSISYSGNLFDGDDQAGECWAANSPQPPFYYYVDHCIMEGYDLSSPTEMYVRVYPANYGNTLVESAGHSVASKALAYGYQNMANAFDSHCKAWSLPSGSSLECETGWEYKSYQ